MRSWARRMAGVSSLTSSPTSSPPTLRVFNNHQPLPHQPIFRVFNHRKPSSSTSCSQPLRHPPFVSSTLTNLVTNLLFINLFDNLSSPSPTSSISGSHSGEDAIAVSQNGDRCSILGAPVPNLHVSPHLHQPRSFFTIRTASLTCSVHGSSFSYLIYN